MEQSQISATAALRQLFQEHGRTVHYRKGQIILRPGDEPRGVYLAETGLIKVYSRSHSGNEHDHLFYGQGDIFPIIWTFDGTFRNVYYETVEDTSLLLVDKELFLRHVRDNVDFAYQLLVRTTALFKLFAAQIDNLLYSNASERIVFRLLGLLNRYYKVSNGILTLDMPLTNQDIARSVATTRETVNRTLARLRRRGIISYDNQHRIIVEDLAALIKIIGNDTVHDMWPDLVANSKV